MPIATSNQKETDKILSEAKERIRQDIVSLTNLEASPGLIGGFVNFLGMLDEREHHREIMGAAYIGRGFARNDVDEIKVLAQEISKEILAQQGNRELVEIMGPHPAA